MSYVESSNLSSLCLSGAYVHLGADVLSGKSKFGNVSRSMGHQGCYLMVGTIEPKKNHIYVLNSFERLWRDGYTLPLVIAGRVGWKCSDVVEKILSSEYYGKYLFMYNDTTDDQLISLYLDSCAVVMSSLVEGYGLPVVEAIQFACPVFASDIPVFREVGYDYPFFFDLSDELSLVRLVEEFEVGNKAPIAHELPQITTWSECVQQLNKYFSSLS